MSCSVLVTFALNCYQCTSSEGNCEPPNDQTKSNYCNLGQQCYTEVLYIRNNMSHPFPIAPSFFQRKCHKPAVGICSIDNADYGPCIKNDKRVTCYHCCSGDLCNYKMPTFNHEVLFRSSYVVTLCVVIFWGLMHF